MQYLMHSIAQINLNLKTCIQISVCEPLAIHLPAPLCIQESIIQSQKDTPNCNEQQKRRVCPVTRWITSLRLIGLVYPHAYDLAWRAERNVHCNCEAGSRC